LGDTRGQADQAFLTVCLPQPQEMPLRHLARRLELGEFRKLAFLGTVQVRVEPSSGSVRL
jgi:hypothetical protein